MTESGPVKVTFYLSHFQLLIIIQLLEPETASLKFAVLILVTITSYQCSKKAS